MTKTWNPSAKNCEECPKQEPLTTKTKDPEGKTATHTDPDKILCGEFGWEIKKDLAATIAVCRIEFLKKRKKHLTKPRTKEKQQPRKTFPGPETGRSPARGRKRK